MRVSDKLIYSQLTYNLQKNTERMLRIQSSLSSGKKIESPSDDPIGNSRSLNYASLLGKLEQYGRNIDRGLGTLGLNDSALSGVTGNLNRLKELAVQMRSDTNTAEDRALAAKEVRGLLRGMVSLANTKDGAEYLYSGDTVRGRYTGTTISAPVTIAAGVNDTLQVTVDGVASGTITLAANAYTGAALATEVQSKINADAALGTKDVTVSYDALANRLVVTSESYGENSSVDVTGGTSRSALGLAGGTSTSGDKPFTLTTATTAGARNSGGATVNSGAVTDENRATLDDYVIKFTAANRYDIYRVPDAVSASDTGPVSSRAVVSGASVIDTGALTLDGYEIRFSDPGGGDPMEYDIVDTIQGVTLSSGNVYTSGGSIEFDGLHVSISDGSAGGPADGDIFSVSAGGAVVSTGNSYVSGAAITFEGLQVIVADGGSGPAANDAFAVQTKHVFNGDLSDRRIAVGENSMTPVGMSGGDLFSGLQGGTDLLAAVKNFYNSLMGNDAAGLDSAISQMDLAMEQVSSFQSEVGARVNYLDSTRENIEAFKINIATLKSGIEDIDLSQVASDLAFQEAALLAARETVARMIQPSLLDFLR